MRATRARTVSPARRQAEADARSAMTELMGMVRRPEVAAADAHAPLGLTRDALVSFHDLLQVSLRNHRSLHSIQFLTRAIYGERKTLDFMLVPDLIPERAAAIRIGRDLVRKVRPFVRGGAGRPPLSPVSVAHEIALGYQTQLQQALDQGRSRLEVTKLTVGLEQAIWNLRAAIDIFERAET